MSNKWHGPNKTEPELIAEILELAGALAESENRRRTAEGFIKESLEQENIGLACRTNRMLYRRIFALQDETDWLCEQRKVSTKKLAAMTDERNKNLVALAQAVQRADTADGTTRAVLRDNREAQRLLSRAALYALGAARMPGALQWARDMEAWMNGQPLNTRKVVALCGSSRFIDVMAVAAWEEEKKGHVALSCHLVPGWYTEVAHHLGESQGVAEPMDALHLDKIQMADEILVIDVDGYIGESTANEIKHARDLQKPIRYLSQEAPAFLRLFGTKPADDE